MNPRIVVVTPCRNEEEHLPAAISTMADQSLLPARWVVVDDGSTDGTSGILDEAAREHAFLRVVRRPDRGSRSVGPGVIDAFYSGLDSVRLDDFDYVLKLDADLELPPDYLRGMVEEMTADPCRGNFSGKVYTRLESGRLVLERMGDENAVGAAKFYRRECFEEIGGFVRQVSWDGIDGHMCRMKGWIAGSRDDPDLRLVQRRLMGTTDRSIWVGRKRWGRGKYFMGSSLPFVLAVAAYRTFERPFLVGGAGILAGYLGALFSRQPRLPDREVRRFLRRYERTALLRGKRRTTDRYNRRIREEWGARRRADHARGQ